ncbi:HMG1/2-like protein [Rhododendron vialii]|uniref:HMG1/2-like protein n=1 Tax=Rhododendron vialii TaxID=182163 RepID=UPI00265FA491|nr:HMG1/2-like protein [Rhododendron vialii]
MGLGALESSRKDAQDSVVKRILGSEKNVALLGFARAGVENIKVHLGSFAVFKFAALFSFYYCDLVYEISEFQVGKAGGEKWKAMSESEKAPFVAKAVKKKAEYVKAKEEFDRKLLGDVAEKPEESEKSSSEVHDVAEQEASS